MTVNIDGIICPNDYAWYYDFFEMDYTCPRDIADAIREAENGEKLIVKINSPGGEIASGSEIYTMLRNYENVEIHITGQACSAASIIAMAGYCVMSPTALMMVHCVSSQVSGNHADMEKMADVLKEADRALCSAYVDKAGMTEAEALDMMEDETWLTAKRAKEYGLIDEIMFEDESSEPLVASLFGLPTQAQLDEAWELRNKELNDDFYAVTVVEDDEDSDDVEEEEEEDTENELVCEDGSIEKYYPSLDTMVKTINRLNRLELKGLKDYG